MALAYGVLGATLVASRLLDLGQSFWLDEAVFVQYYVRQGPSEILTGESLSHELYGVLDWLTASVVGESEFAFRMWSAVPFVLGVALVTAWLHRRHDPLAGVSFLFLATVSPLLLDISRQARGYGLAFLAMAVVIVSALEARRSGRTWAVAAMCAAGVVGAWTLPQFGIAFAATATSLLADRRLRRRVAVGLSVSIAAIVVWFAPHLHQIYAASQNETGGTKAATRWALTAPIDQLLLPALAWIEGGPVLPSVHWLPFMFFALLVIGSSPFFRMHDGSSLILCSGTIAITIAFWLGGVYTTPRYMSFLLVPLFMLAASGSAAILRSIPKRRAPVRVTALLFAVAALALHFVSFAPDVVRLPREANREAANAIETRTPDGTPVYALLKDPLALDFYLDRPFEVLLARDASARVCGDDRTVAYVMQPWAVGRADVPCLNRRGVEHLRFPQYARGREINVWLVPPSE